MTNPEMIIEAVPIMDLIPAPYNPRGMTAEERAQIKASLERFGFVDPVIANRTTGHIVGGHQRVRVAGEDLGYDVVPVHWVELSEAQERELNIRLNANNGHWEFGADLQGFRLEELEGWGIDGETLQGLGEMLPPEEPPTDDAPAPPKDPITKPGDLYIIGKHRLVCGDGTDPEVVAMACNDKLADLLLTDPPYNVAYVGKTAAALTIENDSMNAEDFRNFLSAAFCAAANSMNGGASAYIFHAHTEGPAFIDSFVSAPFHMSSCLVWNKDKMVLGRSDYQWKHEAVIYGWKEGAPHNWYSDRKQTTVLEFDRPSRNEEHPTMKPVEILQYLIGNSSKRGDLVLDNFGGSGSTLIACEATGRRAALVELDPAYCDVIVKRWEDFTGGKAERVSV